MERENQIQNYVTNGFNTECITASVVQYVFIYKTFCMTTNNENVNKQVILLCCCVQRQDEYLHARTS